MSFSLLPYLTPSDVFESKPIKKGLKRIRKPVMYDIEPMPDKIEVQLDAGDQQDQAFIGDPYCLNVTIAQRENVKLRSLRLFVVDIISTLPNAPGLAQ